MATSMRSLQIGPDRRRLRVLCLGAHSDDIEIGCAGTLWKWLAEYDAVELTWVVMSAQGERAAEARRSARSLARRAADLQIVLGDFDDALLPAHYGRAKAFLKDVAAQCTPDVVLTHRLEDRHQDHRLVAELSWQTWRHHLVLEYEIPKYEGDLGQPNLYVPLSAAQARRKVAHLARHFGSQRGQGLVPAGDLQRPDEPARPGVPGAQRPGRGLHAAQGGAVSAAMDEQALRARQRRARELIPGGAHTYAKGDDQFPEAAPPFIARGEGCHVWDPTGREYIEYGMGLRAVTLGHGLGPVVGAAAQAMAMGTNFTRPSPLELDCAEQLLALLPGADMVKFCSDGSHAVDGAIRLARAHTGRDMVAACADHPFYSTGAWFIGSTAMNAGVPQSVRDQLLRFRYNDLDDLGRLFDAHPGRIACVVMEPARTEEPAPGYLQALKARVHAAGAVLVFDEMITGFRWGLAGAQQVYGVDADLCTFGKAFGNGFGVSALAGRRELMTLGGFDHDRDRVFLLSTTHGAQTHHLAAALATMRFYLDHPVIETLYARGARLRAGVEQAVVAQGLVGQFGVNSRDCNLLFFTRDAQGQPSQAFRTLFMQEMVRRGIIAPSFVVSYAHSEDDIDRTVDAVHQALAVYRRALDGRVEDFLDGRPVQPALRPRGDLAASASRL